MVDGNAVQTAERLLDLRRRITSGLKLPVYEVPSTAEVGVIFETLNDRGRPLTSLEKIKNYLLYLASQLDEPRSTDLADRINPLVRHLQEPADASSEVEDRLLRAHWLTTQNPAPGAVHAQGADGADERRLSSCPGQEQDVLRSSSGGKP